MKLVIEDETGRRSEIPFETDEITIGRDPSNLVQLTDRDVSRHHCRLFRSPEGLLLEDLQSSNGLFVNGNAITGRRQVQVGDRIEIGDYRILILDEVMGRRRPAQPQNQVVTRRRKPTPIPKFPGLPKNLDVTPGPPRSFRQRQEEALSPGPRLAPLPETTPGPPPPVPTGTTPGPNAPILAITPGPAGPRITVSEVPPGPASMTPEPATVTQGPDGVTPGFAEAAPGPAAATPGPAAAPPGPTATPPGPAVTTPGPAARELARLVILAGELAGTSIPLPAEPAWIGSGQEAELVLAHPSIAARHCRIEPAVVPGQLLLRASPGLEVTVNGVAGPEAVARSGDMIRLGSVLLRYVAGG